MPTITTQAAIAELRNRVEPGDALGFSGNAWLSAGIAIASVGIPFWSLSHIGIVADYNGQPTLFESTIEEGVQARDIDSVASYDGKVWHYPLHRPLYEHESARLTQFLTNHLTTPYDSIGAIRSGGIGFSFVESLLREQDLSSIFCAELVAASHNYIGLISTDHFSKWNPARLVRYERSLGVLLRPTRITNAIGESRCES